MYFVTLKGEGRTSVAQREHQSPSRMEASAQEMYQRPKSIHREAIQGSSLEEGVRAQRKWGRHPDRMHILSNIQISI